MGQREFQKAEANRERREAAERRTVEEPRKSAKEKSAKEKKRFRKKAVAETIISQSSAQEHMFSGEEVPTMLDKLDSEEEDGVYSIGKVAQVDIHPPLECGISSELHRPSEERDSITFEKLDMVVSEDSICFNGNVTQVEAHPVAEEVISSKLHMPSKLKDTSMAEVDSVMHGEELSDWMSQLFEKLDMEVSEDSICSAGNVTQVEAHPVAEDVISSEIQMPSKLKDMSMAEVKTFVILLRPEVDSGMHGEELSDWMSQLFEKLDMEVSEDSICSTGNVTQVEAHPVAEEVISSKIHMPTKLKDTCMAHTDVSGSEWRPAADAFHFFDKDAFLDRIVDRLRKGGHDDVLSQFDLDQADMRYDVQDEVSDLDEDAEDSHTSVKRVSNKETLENGIKWMSEECFLAFTESAERNRFEGIKHKFGELRRQCLNIEAYDKIFHHYNFTIEAKYGSSDIWSSELYFAEVKQLFGLKSYFCCLLEPTDDGRCYGCQNMKCDLQHPSRGGYEEGNADMCWPFIDETDSGSDCDCRFGS